MCQNLSDAVLEQWYIYKCFWDWKQMVFIWVIENDKWSRMIYASIIEIYVSIQKTWTAET